MFALSTLLIVGGLALDILGAAIIALPDIPRAKLILGSEVVRRGMHKIEATGIQEGEIGFEPVKKILEQKYGAEIPDHVWAMRVGFHTMSRYGYEAVYLFTDPNDESKQVTLGKDLGLDIDYRVVRKEVQVSLDRFQALVRGIGFLLLSTGFTFQIIGQFV
jgi:hypothetical protein